MSNLNEKFLELENCLNEELLERPQETHTAVLALVSRKHHFQFGPPGAAKSLLVDRLARRIGLKGDEYFRWLLTRYTVPEELYGGPDLKLLREEGVYKRITKGKMPVAKIVFLDETFKGNSSILNANLTLLNERKFDNHDDDPHVPLISMFGASNELSSGDELAALWDRLTFRHKIAPLQETSSFMTMMSKPIDMDAEVETVVTVEDLAAAYAETQQVVIPKEIYNAIRQLREDMVKDDIYISERRWMDCLPILKAEAWLAGRGEVEKNDIRWLQHVLWSDDNQIKTVQRLVLSLANPLDKEAMSLGDDISVLRQQFKKAQNEKGDEVTEKGFIRTTVEIVGKLKRVRAKLNAIKKELEVEERTSQEFTRTETKFKELVRDAAKAIGVEEDDLNVG